MGMASLWPEFDFILENKSHYRCVGKLCKFCLPKTYSTCCVVFASSSKNSICVPVKKNAISLFHANLDNTSGCSFRLKRRPVMALGNCPGMFIFSIGNENW